MHKILHSNQNYKLFLACITTENKIIRMTAENKIGPKPRIERDDLFSTKTFKFKIVDIYNSIPRKLTLLNDNH